MTLSYDNFVSKINQLNPQLDYNPNIARYCNTYLLERSKVTKIGIENIENYLAKLRQNAVQLRSTSFTTPNQGSIDLIASSLRKYKELSVDLKKTPVSTVAPQASKRNKRRGVDLRTKVLKQQHKEATRKTAKTPLPPSPEASPPPKPKWPTSPEASPPPKPQWPTSPEDSPPPKPQWPKSATELALEQQKKDLSKEAKALETVAKTNAKIAARREAEAAKREAEAASNTANKNTKKPPFLPPANNVSAQKTARSHGVFRPESTQAAAKPSVNTKLATQKTVGATNDVTQKPAALTRKAPFIGDIRTEKTPPSGPHTVRFKDKNDQRFFKKRRPPETVATGANRSSPLNINGRDGKKI